MIKLELLILLFLIPSFATAEINELQISTSEVAPFFYSKNGKMLGYHVEILNQLENLSGLKFKYTIVPHARLTNMLENSNPDLVIFFKNTCEKYADTYEVQTKLYSVLPSIFIKSGIEPTKQAIRLGRINGTCSRLAQTFVKKDMILDLSSIDQAIAMLKSGRLDGVCSLPPVLNYSIKESNFKRELVLYKTESYSDLNDAVICRKKSLPLRIKKKLEMAAKKLKIPKII